MFEFLCFLAFVCYVGVGFMYAAMVESELDTGMGKVNVTLHVLFWPFMNAMLYTNYLLDPTVSEGDEDD